MMEVVEQIKTQSGKKWVKGINDGLKDKGLGEHLNSWIPYVHGGLKCEMALLTVQYDPNIMSTSDEAWRDVLRMEKTVVDVLGMESEVLYVISVIETHPGKKGKTNQKKSKAKPKEKKEEKKEVKVVEETIKVESIKDVDELFKKYTHEFKEERVEDMKIVNERQKEYLRKTREALGNTENEKKMKEGIEVVLGLNTERLHECIYPMMIGMLNGTKIKKETKEEEDENKEEVRLKGYPHIHMGVAFTTTTGIMKDLGEMKRKLLMYVPDVDFRKKDGTSTSTRRRRGRQVDIENDAKILGYILKNSRHEGTMEKLGRMPVVVYNIRKESNISNLYGMLYKSTGAAMMEDVRPREKIEVKMPFILEIISDVNVGNVQTNLPKEVTNKPKAQTKLMQMINLVETYLERNQMAITPRGTIYERIKESRKSWRYWGTAGQLYKTLTTKETVELLNKTKKSYEEYTTGGYESIFPYINIDYKWIEFNDFYFYIPTGEVVKKNEEVFKYECFAYCPEVKYEQIYPEMKITPRRWLKILENSGYIVEGQLTEEGVKVVKGVYSIMKPKKHKEKGLAIVGESDSGKSSLIIPVILLFPRDTIVRLTDAGGFGLARLTRNPEIVISEEHHKNRLRRDEALQLLEGNIEMSVNIKQKVEEEVFVKARVIFLCNEKDWAYKQNISLLTIDGEKPEEKIDAAYTNRLIFCQMRSLPVEERSADVRDMMIVEERSIIPLYAAKVNFGINAFKEMIEIV
jgi:hypothetical protein